MPTRLVIPSELGPSDILSVEEIQLGTKRRLDLTLANEEDITGDGDSEHVVVLDEARARLLFNWLGAWLHGGIKG